MFGNRIVGVVNVLLLTYLLSGEEFGLYILASTNVLVLQILAGWWLTSSAYKFLAHRDEALVDRYIASLRTGAVACAIIAAVAALLVALLYSEAPLPRALVMAAWAAALVVYDLTLAANNALGQSRAYAALAMVRNALALVVSIGLVLAGWGAIGAMLGQVLGLVVPLAALRSANRLWRRARGLPAAMPHLREMFRFGLAGMCVLGLYMLSQGLARNGIEARLGVAAAGQFSFATDLFNAPIMLLGSAFSLSRMRALYQAGDEHDLARARDEAGRFIETYIVFALPYALAGAIVAPALGELIGSASMDEGLRALARPATLQASALQVIAAVLTAMLVFDMRWRVIAIVAITAAANLAAVMIPANGTLGRLGWTSAAAMGLCCGLCLAVAARGGAMRVDLGRLLRAALAAAACAAGCAATFYGLGAGLPAALLAITVGAAVFLAAARFLDVIAWGELWQRADGSDPPTPASEASL